MTEIIDNFLFIGGESNARDGKWLTQNRIEYILTCAEEVKIISYARKHLHIKLHDFDHNNMFDREIQHAIEFIDKCRQQNQRILIHCYAGINRSVTVAMFYLALREGYDLISAFEYIRGRREYINPVLSQTIINKNRCNNFYSYIIDEASKKYFNTILPT